MNSFINLEKNRHKKKWIMILIDLVKEELRKHLVHFLIDNNFMIKREVKINKKSKLKNSPVLGLILWPRIKMIVFYKELNTLYLEIKNNSILKNKDLSLLVK
jgi:hypothetical protein